MSRISIAIVGVAALTVGIAVVLYYLWGSAYSTPEISLTELGGNWEAKTTRSLGGTTGGHTALYRKDVGGRRHLIAPIVFKETYIGDDCVVYATPEACWAACGAKAPVVLVQYCDRWNIVDGRFQTIGEIASGISITVEDIKSRAEAAPLRRNQ